MQENAIYLPKAKTKNKKPKHPEGCFFLLLIFSDSCDTQNAEMNSSHPE